MLTPLYYIRLLFFIWVCSLAGSVAASANYLFELSNFLQCVMFVAAPAGILLRLHFGTVATSPLIPTWKLPKGGRVVVFGVVALAVFFVLPPVLRVFDPTAGGFAPDTINAAALGAFHYFAALSIAYISWRWLFPDLYTYAVDCMEGKLLENLTDDLKTFLGEAGAINFLEVAERRHIAQFQFLIRCTRFVLSLSPFLFFFVAANHALTAALTAVPGSAPGL